MRCAAVLIVLACAGLLRAQDAAQALEAVEALKAAYNKALATYLEKNKAARSLEERQALWEKRPTKDELWVPRFFAIAKSAPSCEAAFRSLLWIVQHSGRAEDHRKSLDALLSDHMANPGLGPATKRFIGAPAPTSDPRAEVIMRRIIKESPHAKVRGETAFYLAKWLIYHRPHKHEKEVTQLLRSAVSSCRSVPAGFPYPSKKLSEVAAAELFAFQHLRIGRKAPDVEGEDVAGRALSLADYRGKVVLLDFWGHW